MSDLNKYAFINAKLRARISMLIPDDAFQNMIKAGSIEEALAHLRATPFAFIEEIYKTSGDILQVEFELLKHEIAMYRDIHKYLHKQTGEFSNALLMGYEIENLKNALRISFEKNIKKNSDTPGSHYLLYDPVIHTIDIDTIISAPSFDQIPAVLSGTPYAEIVTAHLEEIASKGTLFYLEVALDHFYYSNLLEAAKISGRQDREKIFRLIGVEIDLQNITWIIRFKDFYKLPVEQTLSLIIPSGFNLGKGAVRNAYTGQNIMPLVRDFTKKYHPALSALITATEVSDNQSKLQLIEHILEQIMLHETHKMLSGYPFTIGILLAYFMLKKNEIKKIKTILNAKLYGYAEERIRDLVH